MVMPINAGKPDEDIRKRLNRIEGQIKGIQRMVAEGKPCRDILTQIAAARAALHSVGSLILERHAMSCLENALLTQDKEKAIEELTRTVESFIRFAD
ncbi:MAG: metal-sensitive transcriptional regulator [Clostridiaceae bacterium]|jgi:DNA-binding FrmR family transcriptional regulator|nr:metal-sensitive transcriptional regulator [Clostridiaceae bacterium]